MKKHLFFFFFLLLVLSISFSCTSNKKVKNNAQTKDSLTLKYAEGFSIRYFDDYKEVIVYSPWVKGTEYARYYLVTDLKINTPKDGTKVKIPLLTLAATSVTHFEFLNLLGELETITGVCSPAIIYNPEVR